ncbi:MAG: rRNA maturation RNase YbeY [Devosiaceae bacterium]|nr:rRNA maturation RNase YbeY [Devosiaceae bacterium]
MKPIKKILNRIRALNNNLTIEIDINIDDDRWNNDFKPNIEKTIFVALSELNAQIIQPIEISILLSNDKKQQQLNLKWRNIDKTTNVLSFPQIEPFAPLSGLLGDISFAYETIISECEQLNIEFEQHFTHLLVHGLLHLLGYDHQNEESARIMEDKEIKILKILAIGNPYNNGKI